jgi:hypothetical protein
VTLDADQFTVLVYLGAGQLSILIGAFILLAIGRR